jgi:hypothetical protein
MSSPHDSDTDSVMEESEEESDEEEFDLAAWVGQCYGQGFTPQQVLASAREHLPEETVNTHIALHNTRLLAAAAVQQQAADPVVTVELVPDSDDEVEWVDGVDAEPAQEHGVQYAPVEHEDWAQLAQAEGTVVFAGAVADPFDVFEEITPAPSELCTVCQEQLFEPVVRSTVCHHCFHRECIDGMIDNNNEWKCPNCRAAWG